MYALSVVVSLATAAITFFVRHDFWSAGAYALLWPLVLLRIPRFIYTRSGGALKTEWLRYAEWAFFVMLLVNAPGTAYFHTEAGQFQYDRFLHIVGGAFSMACITLFMMARVRDYSRIRSVFGWLVLAVFAAQVLWEGFQASCDRLLGTIMYYDTHQGIMTDMLEDIFFGLTGALFAAPFMWGLLKEPGRFLRAQS